MKLDEMFASIGAAGWGAVSYEKLLPHMDQAAREKAEQLCPHAATVLVAAFPYYAGPRPGNLSLYARGMDYHLVLLHRLEKAVDLLREEMPHAVFVPGADNSPLPEREAAWQAGLGLKGENGLVILPPYGSWIFLGTILTDHVFPVAAKAPSRASGPLSEKMQTRYPETRSRCSARDASATARAASPYSSAMTRTGSKERPGCDSGTARRRLKVSSVWAVAPATATAENSRVSKRILRIIPTS